MDGRGKFTTAVDRAIGTCRTALTAPSQIYPGPGRTESLTVDSGRSVDILVPGMNDAVAEGLDAQLIQYGRDARVGPPLLFSRGAVCSHSRN